MAAIEFLHPTRSRLSASTCAWPGISLTLQAIGGLWDHDQLGKSRASTDARRQTKCHGAV